MGEDIIPEPSANGSIHAVPRHLLLEHDLPAKIQLNKISCEITAKEKKEHIASNSKVEEKLGLLGQREGRGVEIAEVITRNPTGRIYTEASSISRLRSLKSRRRKGEKRDWAGSFAEEGQQRRQRSGRSKDWRRFDLMWAFGLLTG